MQFNLGKVKSPTNQKVTVIPTDKDPITFWLKPINTDISFMCEQWRNSDPMFTQQAQFNIGVKRVMGWEDITDENGEKILFTSKNLSLLVSMPEAIPYFLEIGMITIEEVYEGQGKKMKNQLETPEA